MAQHIVDAAASAQKYVEENKKNVAIAAGVTSAALLATIAYRRTVNAVPTSGPYPVSTLPEGAYDAVIVGAGPSGSVCGYYLSKAGAKVALLDKESFPRDKYCGDAVCTPAIRILEDMGVLQELKDNNECHFADNGGFVSPKGISYIGVSKQKLGEAAACAVKRIILDNRVAKCAARTGADLKENFEVTGATFDKETGLWTVTSASGTSVKGRILVCADGATSPLATKLGYCTEAPRGVCSRAFIEGGSHNTNFDGVCFYPKWSLPGYAAIFRHANDELNYCYYLIPCGNIKAGQCGEVSEADLARLHNDALTQDPFISKAVGPNAKIERMRAASLRLGGQGLKANHDDHLIIVGDAAGHIDPLTGEGIHTAMMGGKAAAEAILAMRATGDYSKASTKQYDTKIHNLFTHDFYLSQKMAELVWRFPILLDAVASEMQRQGDTMMSKWAEIMTNMRPKTYFLQPHVAIPMGFSILREIVQQKFLGKPDNYQLLPKPASTA
uniref:FAD-binding domain-containing protein n=1 Tax=Polytomella parva TaxID=51329 RepID=A0A7S0UUD0_9CHLO|mmetsp:Transcript_1814/g.2628  ORF Transcript_1814/g.2628 Transcript_1814/m.2628 type:complete len:499 (+) Transcript_1814:108-1604(+)|eukprot:CAMPEP_0175054068 /NCGR_PEP_ID=MMETSP0052_2-20121109/9292_1 /TAXON_ID=51329 ORGANISM="Polytomella parva, Strain SAG 63-3" /NCGR_SAMPLE_ID=MMETSP0052_2 /ASSEMBLY_ACC=CAM_ASM_000194 /LENGTH=498 /DNA_ID=CAMNT_0016318707 /DNA_START=80 /DNA_END=1576 /DNA_ORIENTATION=+